MQTRPALDQFATRKDEHEKFLATGQHDEVSYVETKAKEMRQWEQVWEDAKREGTNGVHTERAERG